MEGRDSLLGLESSKHMEGISSRFLMAHFSVMSEPRGNEKTVRGARFNS